MASHTPRKFRVWDLRSERMIYDLLHLHFAEGWEGVFAVETAEGIILRVQDTMYKDREGVLMQSTGLTDAEGVEVYDGDVMQVGDQQAVVRWRQSPNGFYLDFFCRDDTTLIGIQVDHPTNGAVVIGDRYRNPDLIDEVSA